MIIFLDLKCFDFENEKIIDYLESIKENFIYDKIYLSKNITDLSNDILKFYKLDTNIKDDHNSIIYFKNKEFKGHQYDKKYLVYHFDISSSWWKFRVRADDEKSYNILDPNFDNIIFNRMGAKNKDEVFLFPYGFLFRCTGLGSIDKYGFRKSNKTIDESKKVIKICILGGSAGWGCDNLYSKTFGSLLQKKLNNYLKDNHDSREVSVLNFSQHSYLVVDQMLTYMLHIKKINPDIIILHDGFNDLLFGSMTDPSMLKDSISYSLVMETISQKIYNSNQSLTQKEITAYQCINNPIDVVKSYFDQKNNLIDIIKNSENKTKVISALQPFIMSKNKRSKEEFKYINDNNIFKGQFGEPYSSILYLYEQACKNKDLFDINFHYEFKNTEESLFSDFCHTNNAGEEFISEIYLKKVIQLI